MVLCGLGQFESDRLSELEDRVTILEEEVSDLVGLYTHVWHLEHIASAAGNEANQARNQVRSLESDIGWLEGRLDDLRGQLASHSLFNLLTFVSLALAGFSLGLAAEARSKIRAA